MKSNIISLENQVREVLRNAPSDGGLSVTSIIYHIKQNGGKHYHTFRVKNALKKIHAEEKEGYYKLA